MENWSVLIFYTWPRVLTYIKYRQPHSVYDLWIWYVVLHLESCSFKYNIYVPYFEKIDKVYKVKSTYRYLYFFLYIKYLFTMNLFQCDLTWASCDSSMVHTYFYFHFFFLSQSLSILGSYACKGLNLAINLNIVSHLARYKMTNVLGRLRFGHPWPLLTNVSHFEIRVGGTSNSIVSGKVTRSDIN